MRPSRGSPVLGAFSSVPIIHSLVPRRPILPLHHHVCIRSWSLGLAGSIRRQSSIPRYVETACPGRQRRYFAHRRSEKGQHFRMGASLASSSSIHGYQHDRKLRMNNDRVDWFVMKVITMCFQLRQLRAMKCNNKNKTKRKCLVMVFKPGDA